MEKTRKNIIAAVCIAALIMTLCLAGGGALGYAAEAQIAQNAAALHAGSSHIAVTDDGHGKYGVEGQSYGTGDTYVYFDPIAVPQDGKIYISVDLRQVAYRDDADSWLTFMVGSDQSQGAYGPNTVLTNGKGPYYSQLMRCWRNGTVTGDYFTNGVVRGSIALIPSYNFEICLQYSGSQVTVFVNGQQGQSFTAADSSTCHISFVQYSVIGGDIFAYDLAVGNNAVCADTNYDLAFGEGFVDVPLKTMGNDMGDITLYDGDGSPVPAGEYSVRASDGGLKFLRINSSRLADTEGGKRNFLLDGGNGRTAFTVTTVDNTVAAVTDSRYDMSVGKELRLPVSAGTLTDLHVFDGQMNGCDDLLGHNEIVFPQGYFTDYGVYEFYTRGRKVSGEQSELYRFTVTVYDSRDPSFRTEEFSFDGAAQEGALGIPFCIYDGTALSVRLNGLVVPSGEYSVTASEFILSQSVAEQLKYGRNTLEVVTDKNEASITLIKTDTRTPTVAPAVTLDKGDGAQYYFVAVMFYSNTAEKVILDGKELSSSDWRQVYGGLRIEAAALPLAPDGVSLRIVLQSGELQTTLTVINSAPPALKAVHHYDDATRADAVAEFYDGVCDYAGTRFGDSDFPFATYDGGRLYIAADWFAAKIDEGSYKAGDTLRFSVVWLNRHTGREVTSEISVTLYDSARLYESVRAFDKRDDRFELPVFFNGYALRYVKVNGEYTTAFTVTDDGISFSADWIRTQECGNMKYTVYTDAQTIEIENVLEDSRSAVMLQDVVFRKGDGEENLLVPIEFYRNTVAYITDSAGRNIAAYNYEPTDGGILFDKSYLSALPDGYFHFFAGMRRQTAGLTVQEEQAFYIRIVSANAVSVSVAGDYDLASEDDLELTADFGGAALIGISEGGTLLSSSDYRRVQVDLILFSGSYLHTLGQGRHAFTIVTDGGDTEFYITITDSRSNSFTVERLELNKGAGDVILHAQMKNAVYELYIDGNRLDENQYRADGNYITLRASAADALAAGEHTLTMRSGGDEDSVTISVFDGSVNYTVPVTLAVVIPFAAVAAATVAVVLVMLFAGRKKTAVVPLTTADAQHGGEQPEDASDAVILSEEENDEN